MSSYPQQEPGAATTKRLAHAGSFPSPLATPLRTMDFFDYFYTEDARIRQIAREQVRKLSTVPRTGEMRDDIKELKADVQFLTLLLAAILKRLGETQSMSMHDLQDLLDEIDRLDGVPDGGLQPQTLRNLLGVVKQEEDPNDRSEFEIDTAPRQRYRR